MEEKIILWVLVVVLIITNIIGWMPSDNDEKFDQLADEKNLLLKQNHQLKYKIKAFENEIIKNDSIINNSDINQLDSMFTNYFGR